MFLLNWISPWITSGSCKYIISEYIRGIKERSFCRAFQDKTGGSFWFLPTPKGGRWKQASRHRVQHCTENTPPDPSVVLEAIATRLEVIISIQLEAIAIKGWRPSLLKVLG